MLRDYTTCDSHHMIRAKMLTVLPSSRSEPLSSFMDFEHTNCERSGSVGCSTHIVAKLICEWLSRGGCPNLWRLAIHYTLLFSSPTIPWRVEHIPSPFNNIRNVVIKQPVGNYPLVVLLRQLFDMVNASRRRVCFLWSYNSAVLTAWATDPSSHLGTSHLQ
jgi:hypothetical protein